MTGLAIRVVLGLGDGAGGGEGVGVGEGLGELGWGRRGGQLNLCAETINPLRRQI